MAFTERDVSRYPLEINGVQRDTPLVHSRFADDGREHLRPLSVSTLEAIQSALRRPLAISLLALDAVSRTKFKVLESFQAQALRIWLGVPKCISTIRTLCDQRCFTAITFLSQELLHTGLRHVSRCFAHPLAAASASCVEHILPSNYFRLNQHATPQWLYAA